MAELTTNDVEAFTGGQLDATDDETARMLNVALAAARQDVRWHVSPVQFGYVAKLNGTGTSTLRLPTKQVINLTSVVSDGVTLDISSGNDVVLDPESQNLLVRTNGQPFSSSVAGVVVTMDHGFPEDATNAALIAGYTGPIAYDWRQAVLALVTNIAQIVAAGRSDAELASKQIDDAVYRWAPAAALGSIEPILAKYRLLWKWV